MSFSSGVDLSPITWASPVENELTDLPQAECCAAIGVLAIFGSMRVPLDVKKPRDRLQADKGALDEPNMFIAVYAVLKTREGYGNVGQKIKADEWKIVVKVSENSPLPLVIHLFMQVNK